MQNFSPLGNFISSFLKHQANIAASNIVVGGTSALKNTAPAQEQAQTLTQQQLRTPQTQNPALQTAMAEIDNAERALLVKDLLQLPSSLKDLLSTLQNNKNAAQTNQLQNLQNINVAELMELMKTNGKDAISKLMQMTGMLNKQGITDTKQLQELQFIINACMPNANMTNTQFMKNLILLYLPWLPIGENNNFDIEFSSSDEEAGADSADDTITILIQTENYGNVKVLLVMEKANKINMIINCSKIFPKELLQSKITEDSKELKLETAVLVNEHETIEKSPIDKAQKVHMSGASVLNPYVLLMAHTIIREVIEIDKKQTLVAKRKEAVK